MAADNPFPPYSDYLLSRDKVVNYLIAAKSNGWCEQVYEARDNQFVVLLCNDNRIVIGQGDTAGTWAVAARTAGLNALNTLCGLPDSLISLENSVAKAAMLFGVIWPARQTSVRLTAGAPATNLATISGLVGLAEVQAVFDPYLDNRALSVLLNILSFGANVSGSLRLLVSEKQAKGPKPRLTKTYVEDWFKERGVTAGEARLMPDGEHRRFMLLSGGQSLILGMSLNSIDKNEAVRLEPDAADRTFFDGVWASAAPL